MIKKYLKKVIALVTVTISIMAFNPIGVNAEWKQDSTGWWYKDGDSYYTGWKIIDGKNYYFGENGYMVHDTIINGYKIGSDGASIQTSAQSEKNQNSNLFDVDVSIKYNIHLDDKVKDVNPNIIRATRQAMFDTDCYSARINHYNGLNINTDVLIFDVKETGTDSWKVCFHLKNSDEKDYNTIGYSHASVKKLDDGSYIGEISRSVPCKSVGETY
ncbi:hypothetical protein FC789_15605 [Clostridium botulinum]|nr:hypothetical protein [Clostridium botulinum]